MESFGAHLKREREQRKITLDEISVSTKIATRFLLALEEERFDQLPGGIFNKGFVKAYAHHLGIDEVQAVADYVAASEPAVPETTPGQSPELAVLAGRVTETPGNAPDLPWEVIAVALLVIAGGLALWGVYSREKPPRPRVAVPPPLNLKSSATTGQKASAVPINPAGPETPSLSSKLFEPEPKASESTNAASARSDSARGPGALLVLIKAREDSWVSISADGQQITQEILPAQVEKSIEAHNQIVIKTGNAGALDVSFNGRKVPSQGNYNQVKTIIFDPNGLRP